MNRGKKEKNKGKKEKNRVRKKKKKGEKEGRKEPIVVPIWPFCRGRVAAEVAVLAAQMPDDDATCHTFARRFRGLLTNFQRLYIRD